MMPVKGFIYTAYINSMAFMQNGPQCTHNIFQQNLKKNVSVEFVSEGIFKNKSSLVQVMAWHHTYAHSV